MYHFVDVIITAFLPIITTAVTVTTRKCSPTHFSDKKLLRIHTLPMVYWRDCDICSKGFQRETNNVHSFQDCYFPKNSLKLWKSLWKMIREVAKILKHKAKLKAVLFIILVKRKWEGLLSFPVTKNHDSEAQPTHIFMKLFVRFHYRRKYNFNNLEK